MRAWSTLGDLPIPVRGLVLTLAAAAFLAGLYGRFKGIGTWPLGVDEFYISRSIDHVLQVGLPRFSCGGYYTRGLAYQYLVAGFRLFGLTPELAGRLVAGLASLAVLPAAYLVAKRVQGSLAGWLTVIVLSISVWEIEMARFARMYAPFQAVFAWYLVVFLRYTVDRERTALGWMIALSILGVLTWEGGALIGLANLLAVLLVHEQGRLKAKDWLRLAGFTLLLGALVASTRDLRGSVELPAQAAGGSAVASGRIQVLAAWFEPLGTHPVWALGLLVPLGLTAASTAWLGSYRHRPLALAGLCAALAAAAVHLFTLAAGVMALMLLVGLIEWRELSGRPARWFIAAFAAFLAFWLAAYLWHDGSFRLIRDHAAGIAMPPALQHLFGFPAVYDEFVRPWVRTLPILSVLLALALAWQVRSTLAGADADRAVANLLSLVALMLLAVGATPAPRIETRYTFFLYPVLLVLAIAALLELMRRQKRLARAPLALSAVVPLVCFAATEDFQPRHIAAVDSAAVNFRLNMSPSRAAHYYPRNDMRAVGEWLAGHVRPGDVVITGVPSLDQYYPRFDYFFLEKGDGRYEAYVCPDERTERWTNHPVLYSEDALAPILASGRRVYASVYEDSEHELFSAGRTRGWSVSRVWTSPYGNSSVLLITAESSPPAAQ